VHLRWEGAMIPFCGRISQYGMRRPRGPWPVCKNCRAFPVVMAANNDPASYVAPAEYERVRFPGNDELSQVVHLHWTGQGSSGMVLCGRYGTPPAVPTTVDDGPLCQHCVWDSDEILALERNWASLRSNRRSLGSG
jgi:hypothetical protein